MTKIKSQSLSSHNKYRKTHGVSALKWSSKLQNNAQKWANELAKKGVMQHANQREEGENIAYLKGSELSGDKATDMWYEEIKDYDFNRPGFRHGTGHFTQVVWAESKELGVGKAVSKNGSQFVVARYYPPGNNVKTFRENVFPPGSKAKQMKNKSPKVNKRASPKDNKKQKSPASPASPSGSNYKTVKVTVNTTETITTTKTVTGTPQRKPASTERQSNKTFKNTFLRTHNAYRKRHGAPPLKWNSKLAKEAEKGAVEVVNTNTMRALDIKNVGQNMIARAQGELPGDELSSLWYNEESKYNYNSPGFSSGTGKFSQMVWKDTREVGVARAFGKNGQTIAIALYQPPGNARGKYDENVSKPSGPLPTDKGDGGCSCVIL